MRSLTEVLPCTVLVKVLLLHKLFAANRALLRPQLFRRVLLHNMVVHGVGISAGFPWTVGAYILPIRILFVLD